MGEQEGRTRAETQKKGHRAEMQESPERALSQLEFAGRNGS